MSHLSSENYKITYFIRESVSVISLLKKPTTERKRKKGAAKARLRKQIRNQQLPPKLY